MGNAQARVGGLVGWPIPTKNLTQPRREGDTAAALTDGINYDSAWNLKGTGLRESSSMAICVILARFDYFSMNK